MNKLLTMISAVALLTAIAGSAAYAQEQTPAEARAEATKMFGASLPELELYPDSGVVGVWTWMKDVEDGKGALSPKVRELIGLAVASQIPCEFCIHYHRKAASAQGATEQELREASAVAAYTRHWSTMLYGTQVDLDEYKAMIDKLFAAN
jgi:AhpD family alkylhydroperoxidase